MSATIQAFGRALITALAAALSRTSSSNGSGVNITDYDGIALITLDAGAATAGTNPTLDVTLEECDTSGGTYTAVPAAAYTEEADFTQVTTTASMQVRHLKTSGRKAFIRAKWVIGGTSSPAFPFGVGFIGQKQYS